MANWVQLNTNDAASYVLERLIYLHDFIMTFLVIILSLISMTIMWAILNKHIDKQIVENRSLERAWTIFPILVLLIIEIPSLIVLYQIEEEPFETIIMKAVGHQWYWSYEYNEIGSNSLIECYGISRQDNMPDNFAILDTEPRLCVPYEVPVKLLVTSADVLHAWTIPSLGVKADACPGRLNQLILTPFRTGIFFGQCSEICGANHRFMPICLEVVDRERFVEWLMVK